MPYTLHAIVTRHQTLRELPEATTIRRVLLSQGLALIPIPQPQRAPDAAAGEDEWMRREPTVITYQRLSPWIRSLMKRLGDAVFIAIECDAGLCEQIAIPVLGGQVEERLVTLEGDNTSKSAASRGLAKVGAKPYGGTDEFTSVGLGRHRHTDEWLDRAESEVQAMKQLIERTRESADIQVSDANETMLAKVPLNILHISTRLILGGSQENTVLSCEAQVRAGHRVHLAFGPIYGPEGSMLERVEAFASETGHQIHTHEVPDLIRSIHPRRDKKALAQLRRLIEKLDPDIVHTHSSKAGILGRLAAWQVRQAKNARPAIVHTIHGPPFMPEEGNAIQRTIVRIKNDLYARAERNAARKCDAIVSVADAMTEQFLARRIGSPDQFTTVRSGMEIEAFLEPAPGESRANIRDKLGIEQGEFVIGTVARLAQHKGHDDILDALGPLMNEHLSWRLLWVGDGWWTERLMKRVAGMGLSQRVLNTGLVPPEQIPGLMRAMDVLVHPSAREGLPRTIPQALLCGVCPVAYDVDGTREVCVDHQTGRLIPFGDTAALAEAVRWLATHPNERKAMAERGKARVKDEFSAQAMARNLETVYAQAIEQAKANKR